METQEILRRQTRRADGSRDDLDMTEASESQKLIIGKLAIQNLPAATFLGLTGRHGVSLRGG